MLPGWCEFLELCNNLTARAICLERQHRSKARSGGSTGQTNSHDAFNSPDTPRRCSGILEVPHAAVRGLASKDYSPEVIEARAPMPITAKHVEDVQLNP